MKATVQYPVPGIYRHYKGNLYEVIGSAQHSETGETLVVYRALYGEYGLWVRPLEMFMQSAEVQGEPVARFALEKPFLKG
ncbi:DUF1653 domain-containing protein [Halomonas sediminis]